MKVGQKQKTRISGRKHGENNACFVAFFLFAFFLQSLFKKLICIVKSVQLNERNTLVAPWT